MSCNHMLTLAAFCLLHIFSSLFIYLCIFLVKSSLAMSYSSAPLTTSADLQLDEIWQLFAFPQVLPLPGVHACWDGRSALAGPLPNPLQPRPLKAQCQLWPLHPVDPQKGIAFIKDTSHGVVRLLSRLTDNGSICLPIHRTSESSAQGGHWMKTAETRAPTRNVASSLGRATGALGRVQRRRTSETLTSVRSELTTVNVSNVLDTNVCSAQLSLNKTPNQCQLQGWSEIHAG